MPGSKWTINVPGKLMIAGEYAILEPRQHAVVIAVDRFVTAEIQRSNKNVLSLPGLGLTRITWKNNGVDPVFSSSDSRLSFVRAAIKITNQFLRERSIESEKFSLTITSELADKQGRKYGLGSSAAITVAAIAAVLVFNKMRLPREKIFKLAALSHLLVQGNGSGADIAAAIFGGWIDYTAFSAKWVLNEMEEGTGINELIELPWPYLSFSPLTSPVDLELCVGWTKEAAGTGHMVDKIQKLRLTEPQRYEQFLEESANAVACFVKGFEQGNNELVLDGISRNRQALRELGEAAGVPVETPKLKVLCDLAEEFGKAKPSGAGGGDCGIALIHHHSQRERLYDTWIKAGIIPLYLRVAENGVTL